MMDRRRLMGWPFPLLIVLVLTLGGCGITRSYRTADIRSIGDFSDNSAYRKTVGVLALSNTTRFTSSQAASPFMDAFLASFQSAAPDSRLVMPDETEGSAFLWNPPRIESGDIDVFGLAQVARQAGMNAVVSPILMDIRVRKKDTGFWFFHDIAYSLQIQTAAALYDAITGSRLDLGILTDVVDIDEQQAEIFDNGRETLVDELIEVAEEMGADLGERMGEAVRKSLWLTSVIAIENGACRIAAGSGAGLKAGDRFTVLDGSALLTGLDGQRFIVPGLKIGEITVDQVSPDNALGIPQSEVVPPSGSILVPTR